MEILVEGARECGIHFNTNQLHKFETHYRQLVCWAKRMNLTTILDYQQVQLKHFLDSLVAISALPAGVADGGRVLDLGSGGGFPGIPVKIALPDINLALVDSVRKKTVFLQHLVSVLELAHVQVYTGRAESLAHRSELRESFDVVLSRGLAPMRVLAEYTLPFCRIGGVSVSYKKGDITQELNASDDAIHLLGGKLLEVAPVVVTGLEDRRSLVLIEKCELTPMKYPRAPGIPSKRPL